MLRTYIAALFLMVGSALASTAIAASTDDAKQFVDTLGKHVLDVVNAPGGSKEQKQKNLEKMFTENVDIPWMGQFVLGHAWQQATQQQRDQYMQAYQRYLLAKYTTNFADYTGSKYTITDVKSEEDGQFTVNMQIKAPTQAQDTVAGYRLRTGDNGQFKIIDIIIEGVSLISTQRSDFDSVVQQKGMDGLIKAIEDKTKNEQQPPSKK